VITVELMGGLGNQMFQYAAGRAVSLDLCTPLRVDLSWFRADLSASGSTERTYALTPFGIDPMVVPGLARGSFAYRARRCLQLMTGERVLLDAGGTVDPRISKASSRTRLIGYWQCEQYFSRHAATIRSDFTFRAPLPADVEAYASRLRRVASVGVHVRRGDYVSNPAASSELGALPPGYYKEAGRRLGSVIPHAEFFVMSDDLEWCKDNVELPGPTTFVDVGSAPWHDLVLLSSCRHHIIANSSFSWWGAWLAEHPGQQVIAPAKWFADGRPSPIAPERWQRI
jgi:hypothetical protein